VSDRYDRLTRLAELFETSAQDLRERTMLTELVLTEPDVADSAVLAPRTWREVEEQVRATTAGRHGLLAHADELEADAVVVRSTLATYRWIDDLQAAALRTMGSIAARAVGYLAPEVDLGGAVVSAGLIETDAADRSEVVGFLNELAENNPDLLAHASSGGGLLEGLQLRSLLTVADLTEDDDLADAGLRSIGVPALEVRAAAAVRDVAGDRVADRPTDEQPDPDGPDEDDAASAPTSVADLLSTLASTEATVAVQRLPHDRFVVYLPGRRAGTSLRLVNGDHATYAAVAVDAITAAVRGTADARVLLVGQGRGGAAAAQVAAGPAREAFVVEQVVTVAAPSSSAPRIPSSTHVLSLEDRSDPVAVLGSLVNASSEHRFTVVYEGDGERDHDAVVAAGRAVDAATSPQLRAEVQRLRDLGFLA